MQHRQMQADTVYSISGSDTTNGSAIKVMSFQNSEQFLVKF